MVSRVFESIPELGPALKQFGINPKFMIRFHPVARVFQKDREARNLTIKQVAARLKVPQYRLKEIEQASVEKIRPEVLKKYIDFLDLKDFFSAWADKNKDIYEYIERDKRE